MQNQVLFFLAKTFAAMQLGIFGYVWNGSKGSERKRHVAWGQDVFAVQAAKFLERLAMAELWELVPNCSSHVHLKTTGDVISVLAVCRCQSSSLRDVSSKECEDDNEAAEISRSRLISHVTSWQYFCTTGSQSLLVAKARHQLSSGSFIHFFLSQNVTRQQQSLDLSPSYLKQMRCVCVRVCECVPVCVI